MQDKGLTEFKSFTGNLNAGSDSVSITFQACIDTTGEIKFKFDPIILTEGTFFIKNSWNNEESNFKFSLFGKAEDGTEFKTEDFYLTCISTESNEETGSRMRLIGSCKQVEVRRKLANPAPKPILRMCIKGFQNFDQLSSECRLGKIVMEGKIFIDDPDTLTGCIAVQPDNEPADLAAWHEEANDLLEHVRHVMSFASAVMLQRPIIEFYAGDDLEMIVLSQSRQASAPFRTFHFLNQQPVFDAAVKSFFSPPFEVKNLFFAIEWFVMESTYNEIRLVNAMTALENLVASNLSKDDKLIRPVNEFEKIRKKIRAVIRQCIGKWATYNADEADEIVKEVNKKLGDLNRQSIRQKLSILAKNWSVPLDDIGKGKIDGKYKIDAAIDARNLVVHEGYYYKDDKDDSVPLWDHTLVVREIIVRLLLAAIGYRGEYISYFGGYHDAEFTPLADVSDAN